MSISRGQIHLSTPPLMSHPHPQIHLSTPSCFTLTPHSPSPSNTPIDPSLTLTLTLGQLGQYMGGSISVFVPISRGGIDPFGPISTYSLKGQPAKKIELVHLNRFISLVEQAY